MRNTGATTRNLRLIVFTRYPQPGQVKTRLIPALGAEGAARLQELMTGHTTLQARCCAAELKAEIEVRFDGGGKKNFKNYLGKDLIYSPQGEGNVGERMARAFDEAFRDGAQRVLLFGCDCPAIHAQSLAKAFDALDKNDVVFGPAADGGYYLIGLRAPAPSLFDGIEWGTNTVWADTIKAASAHGMQVAEIDKLADVDRPEDLHWCKRLNAEESGPASISIIIPTLNEESLIGETVRRAAIGASEVIVADGGSSDRTVALAREAGARTLIIPHGRASQMNAAALAATGSVLLFLHADTHLPEHYAPYVLKALLQPRATAGAFALGINAPGFGIRIIETSANLRSRLLQLPYGDQALFLRREIFLTLGGYANLPVMEDFEFIQRLKRRGRVTTLDRQVTTSPRRWLALGAWRTTLINQIMITRYYMGTSPARLASFYRAQTKDKS